MSVHVKILGLWVGISKDLGSISAGDVGYDTSIGAEDVGYDTFTEK